MNNKYIPDPDELLQEAVKNILQSEQFENAMKLSSKDETSFQRSSRILNACTRDYIVINGNIVKFKARFELIDSETLACFTDFGLFLCNFEAYKLRDAVTSAINYLVAKTCLGVPDMDCYLVINKTMELRPSGIQGKRSITVSKRSGSEQSMLIDCNGNVNITLNEQTSYEEIFNTCRMVMSNVVDLRMLEIYDRYTKKTGKYVYDYAARDDVGLLYLLENFSIEFESLVYEVFEDTYNGVELLCVFDGNKSTVVGLEDTETNKYLAEYKKKLSDLNKLLSGGKR